MTCLFCDFSGDKAALMEHSATCAKHPAVERAAGWEAVAGQRGEALDCIPVDLINAIESGDAPRKLFLSAESCKLIGDSLRSPTPTSALAAIVDPLRARIEQLEAALEQANQNELIRSTTAHTRGKMLLSALSQSEDLIKRAQAAEARIAELDGAATSFVEQMEVVEQSPDYMRVWTVHQLHNKPYAGPQWEKQFKQLKTALSRTPAQSLAAHDSGVVFSYIDRHSVTCDGCGHRLIDASGGENHCIAGDPEGEGSACAHCIDADMAAHDRELQRKVLLEAVAVLYSSESGEEAAERLREMADERGGV